MKFSIRNRWSGEVQFTADIETNEKSDISIKLGLSVKWAIENQANLDGANLTRAKLDGANLYGANLTRANLDGANLYGANLYGANLTRANLYGANLYGVNLDGANLTRANLYGALNSELVTARTLIVPEGDVIGWKKCKSGVIVKLKIPKGAKRFNATGRKCRAEYAKVLEIFGAKEAISLHDSSFVYKVGQKIKPTSSFDENRWNECSVGIHFYLTRIEAENH